MAKSPINLERILRPITPPAGASDDYSPEGAGRYYGYDYGPILDARRVVEATTARGDEGDDLRMAWAEKPKSADPGRVLKLGAEVLANESKDLQVCAWMVEALGQLRGLDGLREGFDLFRELQEAYWDSAYPQIVDGDTYDRRIPYESLSAFDAVPLVIRSLPLTADGSGAGYSLLNWLDALEGEKQYRGKFDSESDREEWRERRLSRDKKIFRKQWDDAVRMTETSFYERTADAIVDCWIALRRWEQATDAHFDSDAPDLGAVGLALGECAEVVRSILEERRSPKADALGRAVERIRDGRLDDDEPEDEDDDDGDQEDADEEAPESPVEEEPVDEAASGPDWGRAPVPAPSSPPVRTKPRKEPSREDEARPKSSGPPADAEEAYRRIEEAVAFLRADDRDDPVPYLVARALRAGEAIRGRSAPEPPPDVRERLGALAEKGLWGEVLEEAERAVEGPLGRGWLDAHRLAIEALENLGAPTALNASRRGLLLFPDLRERPGQPPDELADAQTLTWLRGLLDAGTTPAPAPPAVAPPGGPGASDTSTDEHIASLLKGDDRAGALRLLHEAIAAARTDRDRFLRKLRLAEVCAEEYLNSLALPLLDDLAAEVEARRLDAWEGAEFCARVARARYLCLDRIQRDVDADVLDAAYNHLVRLDPAAALAYRRDADA